MSHDYVYTEVDSDDHTPSSEYMAAGVRAAELQLAKAGYRLANVLIEIYRHAKPERFLS